MPVHMRAGTIILTHTKAGYTLTETRKNPYTLYVFLEKGQAAGEAILDDGMSLECELIRISQADSSCDDLCLIRCFRRQAGDHCQRRLPLSSKARVGGASWTRQHAERDRWDMAGRHSPSRWAGRLSARLQHRPDMVERTACIVFPYSSQPRYTFKSMGYTFLCMLRVNSEHGRSYFRMPLLSLRTASWP